jgi:hypothetical protein
MSNVKDITFHVRLCLLGIPTVYAYFHGRLIASFTLTQLLADRGYKGWRV